MNIDLAKPMPALPPITSERLDNYITQLALTGKKRKSAMLAMIEPHSLWAYRKDHADLAERELEALAFYAEWITEQIDEAIFKRAIRGVKEPVFYEGAQCGTKRVYSDKLLAMLAKRYIPAFRDSLEIDATVKAGVLVVTSPLSTAEWEKQFGAQEATLTQNPPQNNVSPAGESDPSMTSGKKPEAKTEDTAGAENAPDSNS